MRKQSCLRVSIQPRIIIWIKNKIGSAILFKLTVQIALINTEKSTKNTFVRNLSKSANHTVPLGLWFYTESLAVSVTLYLERYLDWNGTVRVHFTLQCYKNGFSALELSVRFALGKVFLIIQWALKKSWQMSWNPFICRENWFIFRSI